MTPAPLAAALFALTLAACGGPSAEGPAPAAEAVPTGDGTTPAWAADDVIYEVNVRQYSPEGTFAAVTADLDRLDRMGVDILWLMPIHPVGEKNRKGGLGSYYSVRDYQGINPEFGSADDLRALVEGAHDRGMHVILDWVANHTAWDHPWMEAHPEWYTRDSVSGEVIPPVADWSDVADLDYDAPGLRAAMIDALEYWVRDFGLDGYRCDVAGFVPYDFWDSARVALDAIKPVFLLAEWEDPAIHSAFDMTYGWDFHHRMNEVAKGAMPLDSLDAYFAREGERFAPADYRMHFTSNHDENSWNGTVFERMGDGARAFAVLSFTVPGMPLVYSGQEAPMRERLSFFEKDTIRWDDYAWQDFYATLCALKEDVPALHAGAAGGPLRRLASGADDRLYAFARGADSEVLVLLNLSGEPVETTLAEVPPHPAYAEAFTGAKVAAAELARVSLEPWGYRVYSRP
jgi:cyclomaltodextrinase